LITPSVYVLRRSEWTNKVSSRRTFSRKAKLYEVDWKRLRLFLEKVRPGEVLVEGPPGLWRELDEVCSYVLEKGISCIKSAVPVFGACMAFEHFGGDAVIHLGHFPYPWWRPSKPTLFLEAPWKGEVDWESLASEIRGKRVILGAPAQHVSSLYELKSILMNKGIEIDLAFSEPRGLVLGCDYRGFRRGYDEYVIVSGGRFHALGAALYLQRDVLKLDPYRGEAERISPNRELMKRMWKVKEAMEGKRVALIDGIEGQSRPGALRALKMEASKGGFIVKLYRASILTKDFMVNILEEVDFAVVLSCPRMALDDFGELHKPVLAPGEARSAFRRDLSIYSFPW